MRYDNFNNASMFDVSVRNKIEKINQQIEEDKMKGGMEEEIMELQLARYYATMQLGNVFDTMYRRGIPY